jgi:hypothetical protein
MTKRSLVSRWARLGRRRQALLAEAVLALAASSAAIRLRAFKRAIRMGSLPLAGRRAAVGDITDDIRWAVETAARNVPWRALCIQQGLALQWMLRRRGVDARLHYGIAKDEIGELQAHVWVAAGGSVVIGGAEAPRFKCVATFP